MRTRTQRRPSRRLLAVATAAIIAAMFTACAPSTDGSSSVDPTSTAPVSGDEVRVVDNFFEPDHLEVTAGTEVTWVWDGTIPHDVVGDDFDSGIQREGTFSHRFDDPGTYEYRCTLHDGMTGVVTVVDS